MLRLANPEFLILLLPLLAAAWFAYRKGISRGVIFAASARLPESDTTWRTRLLTVLPALTLLGIVLAVIALARPRTVLSRTKQSSNAIAIEMVLDVSGSMEALDLSIKTPTGIKYRTRLDAVKEMFAEFIAQRPDDLVGIVTFGGYASTRAPLTTDHKSLIHVLGAVEIPKSRIGSDGRVYNREETMTAIGDGLATACARIEKAEPKSRIIILLSDGESNTGIIQPEQAVTIAKELNIKVYTIGVGSRDSLVPIPSQDLFGRKTISQQRIPLDEQTLKFIAESTKGKYFHVADNSGLEKALKDIDSLEKTEIDREIYEQYDELFNLFLLPALALILTGAGLNMLIIKRII